MNLKEEEIIEEKKGNKKIKIILFVGIILLTIIAAGIVVLIQYRKKNPTKITTYVDGKIVKDFDQILDFKTDEKGKTEIYFPIKEVAEALGYKAYKGDFFLKSEDSSMCWVVNGTSEIAMFSAKSNKIYTIALNEKNGISGAIDYSNTTGEIDYVNADREVYESNGTLYTTLDGITKGLCISFDYNEPTKVINIYTLKYLASYYTKLLAETSIDKLYGTQYGNISLDSRFTNLKAILDGLIVVTTGEKDTDKNRKYGVVTTEAFSKNFLNSNNTPFILEPKYDDAQYIYDSRDFLIKTDGKSGLMSNDTTTKINPVYDELILMDRNEKLYRIKQGNYYGIVNENGATILHPEYVEIGIDITPFTYNGIRNRFIILDKVIPVKRNEKWGFIDTNGNKVKKFKYDEIGCRLNNTNNGYSLLTIPEHNVIVVKKDGNYTFMTTEGKDNILQCIFEKIFMLYTNGEISYRMTYNGKDWDAGEQLKNALFSLQNNNN